MAVIVASPEPTAVTFPFESTVAIEGLTLDHFRVAPSTVSPSWSRIIAVSWMVSPSELMIVVSGLIVISPSSSPLPLAIKISDPW